MQKLKQALNNFKAAFAALVAFVAILLNLPDNSSNFFKVSLLMPNLFLYSKLLFLFPVNTHQ